MSHQQISHSLPLQTLLAGSDHGQVERVQDASQPLLLEQERNQLPGRSWKPVSSGWKKPEPPASRKNLKHTPISGQAPWLSVETL